MVVAEAVILSLNDVTPLSYMNVLLQGDLRVELLCFLKDSNELL